MRGVALLLVLLTPLLLGGRWRNPFVTPQARMVITEDNSTLLCGTGMEGDPVTKFTGTGGQTTFNEGDCVTFIKPEEWPNVHCFSCVAGACSPIAKLATKPIECNNPVAGVFTGP